MTRKVRIRKRRKIKHTRYIKGGMGFAAKMASKYVPEDKLKEGMDKAKEMMPDKKGPGQTPPTPEPDDGPDVPETKFQSFGKLINFSLSSLLVSPLYIMAVIANLPLNTLNNLSGRSFEGQKTDALGVQLYKYMFEGYNKLKDKEKDIEEKVKDNEDSYIIDDGAKVKGRLVTMCDSDKCNAPIRGGKSKSKKKNKKSKGNRKKNKSSKLKGGYVNTYKTFKEMLGVLGKDEQVIHNLKSLEDTIDTMKMDFNDRKDEIRKMFLHVKDPKLLFKAIVVCNNIIKDCKVSDGVNEKVHLIQDNVIVKNPYQIVDGKLSSHLYMNVCYLNPKCTKSCNKCDLATNLSCALGRLGPDCAKLCNCNLFNNIISIYHSYVRILLKAFAGNSNNLYYIIDLLFMTARFYANTEDKSINKNVYKMYLNLDKIEEIKYVGDFSSVIKEQGPSIELFKKLICKYGIYEIIKENFKEVIDDTKKKPGEIENLKKTLIAICDAPDNEKENLKSGIRGIGESLLSGSLLNPFKKVIPT